MNSVVISGILFIVFCFNALQTTCLLCITNSIIVVFVHIYIDFVFVKLDKLNRVLYTLLI